MNEHRWHAYENLADLNDGSQSQYGGDSADPKKPYLSADSVAHLNSIIRRSISDCGIKIGQYLIDTVFNGDVKTVQSKKPRSNVPHHSQKYRARSLQKELIVHRDLRGRRR